MQPQPRQVRAYRDTRGEAHMRLGIARIVTVLLGTFVLPRDSIAQTPAGIDQPTTATAAAVCAPNESPLGSYVQCALWYDGRELRRGSDGAIIERPGFWGTMSLTRHLVGDSAQAYGRSFERNMGRSRALSLTGMALFIAGTSVFNAYECRPEPTFGHCTTRDDEYVMGSALLIGAGTVALIVSVPFTIRATRSAARAVWWHNAGFAR
jgi:hypothetical protein